MYSLAMLVLCLLDTALVAWLARAAFTRRSALLALVLFLALPLPYDTALVGLGRWIGAGELLEWLSGPRFTLFNLSLPLTFVAAAGVARRAGVPWLQPRAVMTGVCLVAVALLAADWRALLAPPELFPACWADTVRYVPTVAAGQVCVAGQAGVGVAWPFPPAAPLAVAALPVAGALVWWRARWPWLLAGAVAGFALLGLPASRVGPVPGFVGDAVNLLALAVTAVRFVPRR